MSKTEIPARASRYQVPTQDFHTRETEELAPHKKTSFFRWFTVGVIIVIVGMFLINSIVLPWWANVNDQWHYGDARITRFKADVGHGGTSVFIAFDLDGSVMIIEMPGGSIAEAKLYRTGNLIGADADHRIVTVSIADVDGVRDCLIVHVAGATSDIVLYNNGSSFQWTQPK